MAPQSRDLLLEPEFDSYARSRRNAVLNGRAKLPIARRLVNHGDDGVGLVDAQMLHVNIPEPRVTESVDIEHYDEPGARRVPDDLGREDRSWIVEENRGLSARGTLDGHMRFNARGLGKRDRQ